LFALGFSPIQKTVVTISFFQGKRSAGLLNGGAALGAGEYVIGSILSKLSSLGALDFLLSFTFDAGTAPAAVWVKKAETEESKTAMV
jgi:hypothetical protein